MLDRIDHATRSEPAYSVPPVVRAIKVLRYIAAGNSLANQSQAARAIGINRTTLLRLLHTLAAEGFIDRVPGTDDFVLGTGIIGLAVQKILSFEVSQVASPILDRLAAKVGLASHLGILDGREILYLQRFAPNTHLVSNVHVGTRLPAHATTMGRAILAYLSPGEVAALYRGVTLTAATPKTATTLDALRRQLDMVLATGVALSRSNFEAGIGSVAAPVFDHTGKVVAAINVSGPERVFEAVDSRAAIVAAVKTGAAEIGKRLGHIGPLPATAPPATAPPKKTKTRT